MKQVIKQGVMKKRVMKAVYVLVLLVGFALPVGFAQVYLGADLSQFMTGNSDNLSSRDVGAQLGFTASGIGLRAAVQGNIAAQTLESSSFDVLLNAPFIAGSTLYLGVGTDVLDVGQFRALKAQRVGFENALEAGVFGAHAVAGAEVRVGPFGAFGEIQPVYQLGQATTLRDVSYFRTRAGLNIHF